MLMRFIPEGSHLRLNYDERAPVAADAPDQRRSEDEDQQPQFREDEHAVPAFGAAAIPDLNGAVDSRRADA